MQPCDLRVAGSRFSTNLKFVTQRLSPLDSLINFSLCLRGSKKNFKVGVFLEGVVEATKNGDSLVELRVSTDGWPWRGREGHSLAVLFTLRLALPCL